MQFQNVAGLALALLFLLSGGCEAMEPNPPAQTTQQCPAKELQYLVGQPRTVLHTMRFGSEIRFEEPGQMYTQDYVATRTRIIFSADGKIARILCG